MNSSVVGVLKSAWSVLGGLGEFASDPQSELLSQIVNDFYLNRGGKIGEPPEFGRGEVFPRIRHCMVDGQGQAVVPLGWVKVVTSKLT